MKRGYSVCDGAIPVKYATVKLKFGYLTVSRMAGKSKYSRTWSLFKPY